MSENLKKDIENVVKSIQQNNSINSISPQVTLQMRPPKTAVFSEPQILNESGEIEDDN